MSVSLGELARLVNGQVSGDPETEIQDALPPQNAVHGMLTLIGKQYQEAALSTQASAILTNELIAECRLPQLIVEDSRAAFAQIVSRFRKPLAIATPGVHPTAVVADSAEIGSDVRIGPHTIIEDHVRIGDGSSIAAGCHLMSGSELGANCNLFPRVVLYHNTVLHERVTLHSGCILGAHGFGYEQQAGEHIKTSQLGWVQVETDAEIGANTTIDRGVFGPTTIGRGTKIDNLVQIGHNCQIGKHNLICAQVGIAGSTTTGDYVVLAGQAGLADHIHLEDRVTIAAQSGVMNNVPEGQVLFGSPAVPRKQKMTEVVLVSKLPEMKRELKRLKQAVEHLEAQSESHKSSSDQREAA